MCVITYPCGDLSKSILVKGVPFGIIEPQELCFLIWLCEAWWQLYECKCHCWQTNHMLLDYISKVIIQYTCTKNIWCCRKRVLYCKINTQKQWNETKIIYCMSITTIHYIKMTITNSTKIQYIPNEHTVNSNHSTMEPFIDTGKFSLKTCKRSHFTHTASL